MSRLGLLIRGVAEVRLHQPQGPVAQSRALEFYRQVGFYEIPGYSGRNDEVAMEMAFNQPGN